MNDWHISVRGLYLRVRGLYILGLFYALSPHCVVLCREGYFSCMNPNDVCQCGFILKRLCPLDASGLSRFYYI